MCPPPPFYHPVINPNKSPLAEMGNSLWSGLVTLSPPRPIGRCPHSFYISWLTQMKTDLGLSPPSCPCLCCSPRPEQPFPTNSASVSPTLTPLVQMGACLCRAKANFWHTHKVTTPAKSHLSRGLCNLYYSSYTCWYCSVICLYIDMFISSTR